MALDPRGAALALHRFGFGPRPGSIAAIASDPRGALLADLDRPNAGQISASAGLLTSGAANRAAFEFFAERTAKARVARLREEEAKRAAAELGMPMAMEAKAEMAPPSANPAANAPPAETVPQQIFFAEAKAHYDAAITAEIGFAERLVWFWSNHFCVNADDTVMAGGYEREAIRPHVLGRFVELLQAAEGHPAMLIYLDQHLVDGAELGRRHQPHQGAQRESRPRDSRAAYARRAHRLHPGGRHQLRQGDHRLDHPADRRPIRTMAASSSSTGACTSPARRR